MSELKAISGHEIREDIDYNTRGVDPEDKEWNNYGKELCETLYYLKSEADDVIEELKEQSHQHYERWFNLNKQYEGWLGKVQRCESAESQLRYNKYKRCLAMAVICERVRFEFKGLFWSASEVELRSAYSIKIKHYSKWHKRWLELANKFKEA